MSQSATAATQNDMTACFETFNKDGFCSFPHRHCDGTKEACDSRRDMLEHQHEHFVPDFLKFHICSFKINVFLRVFLRTDLKIDVSCEASVDFSWHVTKCHAWATEFAPCHHFAQRWQCDSQKTRNTTRLKCCACHAKMTWEVRKVLRLPLNMQRIFWKRGKSIELRLPHKTTFDTENMLECHKVPRLPRKMTWQPVSKPSTKMGFAASPIDTATAPKKLATRDETCWSISTSISCQTSSNFTFAASKSTFSYEFSYEPTSKSTFRARLPSIFMTCHKMPRLSHGICTLSPLRAALTMRFAKDTQHDTSKVLRLPRKMTWEVPKVLRLPLNMQRIFWKRGKSIAPATQNDFWHWKHVGMSQSATPATLETSKLLQNL